MISRYGTKHQLKVKCPSCGFQLHEEMTKADMSLNISQRLSCPQCHNIDALSDWILEAMFPEHHSSYRGFTEDVAVKEREDTRPLWEKEDNWTANAGRVECRDDIEGTARLYEVSRATINRWRQQYMTARGQSVISLKTFMRNPKQ